MRGAPRREFEAGSQPRRLLAQPEATPSPRCPRLVVRFGALRPAVLASTDNAVCAAGASGRRRSPGTANAAGTSRWTSIPSCPRPSPPTRYTRAVGSPRVPVRSPRSMPGTAQRGPLRDPPVRRRRGHPCRTDHRSSRCRGRAVRLDEGRRRLCLRLIVITVRHFGIDRTTACAFVPVNRYSDDHDVRERSDGHDTGTGRPTTTRRPAEKRAFGPRMIAVSGLPVRPPGVRRSIRY